MGGKKRGERSFLPSSGVSTWWVCYLDRATTSRYLMYLGVDKLLEEGQHPLLPHPICLDFYCLPVGLSDCLMTVSVDNAS